ncbi:MAG: hypothetical protein UHN41_00735, partial [Bacteroidales bacterium]|nr:hypothetical protein [Bacteroidales bacterium]
KFHDFFMSLSQRKKISNRHLGLGQSKSKNKKMKIKEMKRTIKIMSLLFLSIITLTTFSSCERTVFDQENELVGSWIGKVTFSGNNYNDNTFPIMERIETICFSEEGTGVIEYLEYVEDSGYESWLFQSFIYTIGEKQFNIFDFVIIIEKVDEETLVLSCNGVKKEFKKIN